MHKMCVPLFGLELTCLHLVRRKELCYVVVHNQPLRQTHVHTQTYTHTHAPISISRILRILNVIVKHFQHILRSKTKHKHLFIAIVFTIVNFTVLALTANALKMLRSDLNLSRLGCILVWCVFCMMMPFFV